MRTKFFASHYFFISGVTLLLLLPGGTARTYAAGIPGCPPTSPGELETELVLAFNGSPVKCTNNWYLHNDPTFKNWEKGGSMNLPVVTAAIGLYRFPNSNMIWWPKPPGSRNINPTGYLITYVNWWTWFLASQTGQDPMAFMPPGFNPPPARVKLRYFKGTEEFSNVYDASVVTSVIAVRYWAYKNGHTQLIDLSQRFLRANWVLYGMSAGSGPVWTYDIPGRSPNMNYDPAAPRRPAGGYRYAGHFLPLAGTRSKLKGHWESDDKFRLFDRAIEWSVPAGQDYENFRQTDVLNWLLPRWLNLQTAPPPAIHPPSGENLYGLTQADRDRFLTLIQAGTNASSFLPWLTSIRLSTTYRILGWDGWRVSSMETNTNGNNPNMYGIAYTRDDPNDADPSHALATFLYPYSDRGKSAPGGLCQLFPGYMEATNAPHPNHEVKTVRMNLPTSQPLFHLVLSSGAEAYLDNTPPANWPPSSPAKSLDSSSNPSTTIDIAWVTDVLPQGSVTVADNENWNWIDSNPAPHSEAGVVHQSNLVAGLHQHYFHGATETLTINAGDVLYAYVYVDPVNPPSELMLQWLDAATGWEHRAYWGLDQIGWGTNGTVSRRYMGPLPPAGDWVRLEVPASLVGLEGHTIYGMAYTLFGGRVTWDEAGKNDQGGLSASLAIGQSATQSSTAFGGVASRAADGNPEGNYNFASVTHTDYNNQAWWQVDLGASNFIPWVNVWNRTDCCPDRLSNFYVLVSDVPFNSTDLNTTLNQSGVSNYYIAGQAGSPSVVAVGRTGQYVRVQLTGTNYLSLAEVEVFGQLVSAAPPPTPTPTPQAPALVGYWKFDENSGATAADSSGFGHHGTLQNGTVWTSGIIGPALNFDGVDDMVSTNGITDVTNNFTLAFWALPTASHQIDPESTGNISGTSGQRYAFWPAWYDSGHAGAGVSLGTNGVSVYEHAAGYMPALLVYPTTITTWTHIAIVYNNKQPNLYINGVLARTGLTSFKDFVHLNPSYIGGQTYGYFAGRLDEVRAYNRALSAAEVSALATPPPPPPSASVAWVQPSEFSWGPPNTMTAAGYAQNGSGGVQMVWRDETAGTGWITVPYQPTPSADGTWSNTLETSNRCHTYRVYVNYSGVRSQDFVYNGLTSGYCTESASIIWIQPASSAGFGPPGSLVVAGNASNAPSGTQVFLSYRDVTAGTGWIQLGYAPVPDSNNIWLNAIEGANPYHMYQVQVRYDAVTSSICTYQGTNSITWCQ